MENTISEMKNTLEEIKNRLDEAKDQISELGNQIAVSTQAKNGKEKRIKRYKESLRDLW